MNENIHNIIKKVEAKIHSGELGMRSRAMNVLNVLMFSTVSLIVLASSVFIVNFILFSIQVNSTDTLLHFGPRGWGAFLYFFPWPLLLIDAVFLTILVLLLKRFRFGYRTPLLYLFGMLVVFAILFGYVIERHTPANDFFMRGSNERGISPMHGMMHGMRDLSQAEDGICRCEVVEVIDGTHIKLRDTGTGKEFLGLLSGDTYGKMMTLMPRDMVVALGEFKENTFVIFGIKRRGDRGTSMNFIVE